MSELEFRYASWGRRAAAFIIDQVILYPLDFVGAAGGAGVGYAVGGEGGGVLLGALLAFIVFGGYWVYGEGRPSGQMFGKRMVGIRVRAASGGPAGYGKALGRN